MRRALPSHWAGDNRYRRSAWGLGRCAGAISPRNAINGGPQGLSLPVRATPVPGSPTVCQPAMDSVLVLVLVLVPELVLVLVLVLCACPMGRARCPPRCPMPPARP